MPAVMRLHLQDNTFMFSGFKTHAQMQQASRLLLDDDKNIKPFNQFLKDVQTIDKTYNGSYLQAEYNFAVHYAQSAAQWQEFVADADDFYLRYRTAGDERVREQHRLLDGITLPVEDKFWDEFFPPNGWNCRCSVIQVPKHSATPSSSSEAIAKGRSATYLPNSKGENKAKIFRFNPGKEQKIFPPKHPYFPKGCGDCKLNQYKSGKGKPECSACKVIHTSEFLFPTKRGKLYIEEQDKQERENNFITAKFLAEEFDWELHLKKRNVNSGKKSADAFNATLNVPQEFKSNSQGTYTSIQNDIREGGRQARNLVIRFLIDIDKDAYDEIVKNIQHLTTRYSYKVDDVMVIFKDFSYLQFKPQKK